MESEENAEEVTQENPNYKMLEIKNWRADERRSYRQGQELERIHGLGLRQLPQHLRRVYLSGIQYLRRIQRWGQHCAGSRIAGQAQGQGKD